MRTQKEWIKRLAKTVLIIICIIGGILGLIIGMLALLFIIGCLNSINEEIQIKRFHDEAMGRLGRRGRRNE